MCWQWLLFRKCFNEMECENYKIAVTLTKAMLGAENCTMTFSDSRPHSMMDKIPKAPSSPPPAWDQGFDCIIAIPFFLGLSASIWTQRVKKYSESPFFRFSLKAKWFSTTVPPQKISHP